MIKLHVHDDVLPISSLGDVDVDDIVVVVVVVAAADIGGDGVSVGGVDVTGVGNWY